MAGAWQLGRGSAEKRLMATASRSARRGSRLRLVEPSGVARGQAETRGASLRAACGRATSKMRTVGRAYFPWRSVAVWVLALLLLVGSVHAATMTLDANGADRRADSSRSRRCKGSGMRCSGGNSLAETEGAAGVIRRSRATSVPTRSDGYAR